MSRVGLQPIEVPGGVTVKFDGASVSVKGPKGEISRTLPTEVEYKQEGSVINVTRSSDDKTSRSMHGLTRTLIANMVEGVTNGFSKQLEIVGVGYKAIETPQPTQIKVSGIRKDQVGQVSADIRKIRPPEPYKGKGIKYVGEQIQRKAGKAAAGA
jgi:large subunit ribosomal protein L6